MKRRESLRNLLGMLAGSPLLRAEVPDELMGPINVHEFEEVAKRKMHKLAYDFKLMDIDWAHKLIRHLGSQQRRSSQHTQQISQRFPAFHCSILSLV